MFNYLVIEGNIGAGKTSLAGMIAQKHQARLILEQYAENPFLPGFYKEPEKFAFPLELSFLAARYGQLKNELAGSPEPDAGFIVADYAICKSLIFARLTLRVDEFSLFRNLFDIIHKQLPKPGLYVYLHVPVDSLMENIRLRGREYEQEIKPGYLEKLQQGYFKYLRSLKDQKILVLDIQNLDFVNRAKDFETIEKTIFRDNHFPGLDYRVLP